MDSNAYKSVLGNLARTVLGVPPTIGNIAQKAAQASAQASAKEAAVNGLRGAAIGGALQQIQPMPKKEYAPLEPANRRNIEYGTYSSPTMEGGNRSDAWAGVGDYQLRGSVINSPGQTPLYSVGLNFPDDTNIPDYYGELNTPVGTVFGGTNDGNPNINVGYQPNAQANYYLQALANLLRR